ncbi:MAG: GTPase HflX, partial [Planctomycetota bacterium]
MLERSKKQEVNQEVAVLVRVILPGSIIEVDPLEELSGLAKTAGALVVGELVQKRETPDIAYYIGSGKTAELQRLVEFHAADVVIFDNDLSPAQKRNLEQELKVKVLDRTELILDIF